MTRRHVVAFAATLLNPNAGRAGTGARPYGGACNRRGSPVPDHALRRAFPSTALPVPRRVRGRGCAPPISIAPGLIARSSTPVRGK
jgi:hypothetical protein